MRIAFVIFLVIHSFIHLLGFVEAFQPAFIKVLSLPCADHIMILPICHSGLGIDHIKIGIQMVVTELETHMSRARKNHIPEASIVTNLPLAHDISVLDAHRFKPKLHCEIIGPEIADFRPQRNKILVPAKIKFSVRSLRLLQ